MRQDRSSGMRAQVWITFALAAAVAVDLVGAIVGPVGVPWRFPAAMAATGFAGALVGRAIAMTMRVRRLMG